MSIEKFLYLSSLGWLLQEYNFRMGFQVWNFTWNSANSEILYFVSFNRNYILPCLKWKWFIKSLLDFSRARNRFTLDISRRITKCHYRFSQFNNFFYSWYICFVSFNRNCKLPCPILCRTSSCQFNSARLCRRSSQESHARWSTCVLVYFSWLLDHVIYLKLRRE